MIFQSIETDRLILKNITKEDSEFMLSHFSNDDVNQYLYDSEPLADLAEADDIIDFYLQPEPRGHHRWIIIRKSDHVKMGTCGFHCLDIEKKKIDLGYDLRKEFWGNGYMQEAVKAAMDSIAGKLDIKRIDAHIYYDNEKSIALAKRLGFSFYGETEICVFRGVEYLHHIYTMYL